MPDHPPPAPDWILGDDGHWRPPPFPTAAASPPPGGPTGQVYGSPGGPAGPWTAAPYGGAMGSATPYGGPSHPGAVGPPRSGGGGRTAAVILGALAVGAVAVIGVLVLAVAFLGTPATERADRTPTFAERERGDTSSRAASDDESDDGYDTSGEGDRSDDGGTAATGGPGDLPPSEQSGDHLIEGLRADGWTLIGTATDDQLGPPACAPPGWLTGYVEQSLTAFERTGADGHATAEVSITTYVDNESARADADRSLTPEGIECSEQRAAALLGGPVEAQVLPPSGSAPGSALLLTRTDEGSSRVTYEYTVVVGAQRAQVVFCGCPSLAEDNTLAVASAVAAAMAETQGLPRPE